MKVAVLMKVAALKMLAAVLGLAGLSSCSKECSDYPVERLVAREIEDPSEWVDEDGNLLVPCSEFCLDESLMDCSFGRLREGAESDLGGTGGDGSQIFLEVLCLYESACE